MTVDHGMPANAAAAIHAAATQQKPCDVCHDSGTIQYTYHVDLEEVALPCPYCRPAAAREAARGATS